MTAVSVSAQTQPPVPNFSGYWVRPEAGNSRMFYPPESGPGPVRNTDETREYMIGDFEDPILLPHAAAAVRVHGDHGRAGQVLLPAWSLCQPPGVPLILNMGEPIQILQEVGKATILYQRGMQVRHIYLNEAHPTLPQASWFGHSVGHYEGSDTLVVDTIAHDTRAFVDRVGTPKSEKFRVVERYTISPDRQELSVVFLVEDPDTFTTSWSAQMGYVRPPARAGYEPGVVNRDDENIAEMVCAENNRDAAGGSYAIPADESADF